ncbi:MAG: RodZ family helix-turn-helix domain-containing protein [[Actinobacillus] rossii]|uniref:Helix-turn-helix domain-containing protein n=1 Tax=[Actinobacillus] rossii TaxID=123820 RepID=A0A380TQ44_9PAST|nr:helix-turn-helix domain-containing protein [[Actinobacillus] rossii]MDY4505015.1 RodZ family helix-turn-helix domain-containing protein [[Actinobacillus] rossii]SUT89124.1 helix-turn-helix domain-containing protein [[Actinobacillus] rossii]
MTETEHSATPLTVGEQFRQAREKMDLTLETAAKKLNLRVMVLECIENNEFSHKKIPATFMKGYVRNYAKLLKLPESVWANAIGNFGDSPKHDFSRSTRTDRVTNPHSNTRWVGYLTTGVVAVVIGMTVLWWWENYQQSNTERDNLVQNYAPTQKQDNSSESKTSETAVLPAPSVSTDENKVVSTTVNDETNTQATLPVVDTPVATTTQPVTEQAESTQNATESAVKNEQENQPVVAVNGDLQIEITAATSWISVKDANRKVLAQKEYKKGEILSFDKSGPYSVIIGAPGNVKITYKGENYPLKVDGRIAKFKL